MHKNLLEVVRINHNLRCASWRFMKRHEVRIKALIRSYDRISDNLGSFKASIDALKED